MEAAYEFSLLNARDMPEVHQVFVEAFADYIIPIQLTTAQFQSKLKRESIEPSFCVGAYAGTKLVGFILTGLGEFDGKPTAYNAGTGVLPEYRGHQLTRRMYEFLLPKLRESGTEQCLLEVIQENKPAIRSYEQVGFKVTRSLDCFRALKDELLLPREAPDNVTIIPTIKPDWRQNNCFCDVVPTWQNSGTAIKHSPDTKLYLEARDEHQELVGFAAFFPEIGSVAQLAVSKEARNRGVGNMLLQEIAQHTTAQALLFINIDTNAISFKEFLKRKHFSRFLGQYEMILTL